MLAALHGVARAPALQVDHHLALVLPRVVVVVGLTAVIAPAGGSSGVLLLVRGYWYWSPGQGVLGGGQLLLDHAQHGGSQQQGRGGEQHRHSCGEWDGVTLSQ